MAETLPTPEPNLNELRKDLDTTINTLDFTGVTTPDDMLPAKPGAIDIYKKVVGNPVTGSNPGEKQVGVNTLDFAQSLADSSTREIATSDPDPYIKMRPFTYSGDYDAANFDRYYGTKAYKTLGFSPYRDNDALYNQKMTFGDQFVRAAGQWDNLMSTGFMSGIKAWGTMFTDPLAPDLDSARDMKRSMAIGNVSTGGVGGFVANTFLNSAYSIGIGLEFLAEEAALAAATAFSGGLAGEVTLPAMAARGGFLGRQLMKAGELGAKVGGTANKFTEAAELANKFAKTAQKTAGGIDNMGSARQFFGKVASGAFDLVNPLESTATALKSTRYANDLAKTVGTAGAFMDDIIRIKTAASEAKLEGGMVKIDATEKLIEQYRELHGKDPEGEDLKKIEDLSSIEARRTTLYNFPAIMTTNKLLFSTILYPLKKTLGTASTRVLEDLVAEDGLKALAKDPFKVIGKTAGAQAKAAAKSLSKPALYGTYGMTYLKANVAEGLQENIQEAISSGAINHALAVQKDPGMAAYRGYMGYLMDGLKDQVSAQGAETFASGFLMGMFTQPIMTAPAWAVSKGIERFKSKEERDKAKAERDEALTKQQATLNEMANNDINYWAPDIATAVKNGALSNDLTSSASIGDEKSARDAKFRLEFNHIETAINSGKFEDLMTKLADYKNLTPEEALEAFQRYGIGINTKEDAVKALDQMDGVIERARAIKDKYQSVAQEFPNPYNLSGLKPGTPEFNVMADAHMAWREAQKNIVFATTEFESYSERLAKMTDAFSNLASGIGKADAQSLLSTMSLPGLAHEIVTLKQEIKSLGDLEGTGQVRKQKEKAIDLLEKFQDTILEAQDKIKKENITDYLQKKVIYEDAKQAYQKYLGYVAKKNDSILFNKTADEAFSLLTDTLEMRAEQHLLAKSINVLNNPKGFLSLQKRLQDAFGKERTEKDQRIAENLMSFMTMNDENNIIQALGKLGVKVPEDFLAQYKEALKEGKRLPTPEAFIDPATQTEITKESNPLKYEMAAELWDAFRMWMELNNNIKEEESATPAETTAEGKEAIDRFNAFKPELRDAINFLYNKAKADGKIAVDVSLGTFMATDENAIIAIKTFESHLKRAEAEAAKNTAKIAFQITTQVKQQLADLGYSKEDVYKMRPEEAQTLIENQTTKPKVKEKVKGYTQGMPGGRTVTFNPELKTWEFRSKNGKLITSKPTVKKLVQDLSNMPGIIPIWWTRFITDADRTEVRDAFEDLKNMYQKGMENKEMESHLPSDRMLLMEALQGAKFSMDSDVPKNVTDVGAAWLGGNGYKSVDRFVIDELSSIYSSYGMEMPEDTQDLINDAYDLINEYPKGVREKDIKAYRESLNPNQDILALKEKFAKEHGLDIEKAYHKLESQGLLNYSEAPPADVDTTEPPADIETTPVPDKDWKPIINPSALKEGTVLIDKNGKEYVFIAYDSGYGASFSPDDNVTFPGLPESIITKDREGKTVEFWDTQIRNLSLKPFAPREKVTTIVTASPTEIPVKPFNKEYEGKIIFVTPGSGKTKLAEDNEDIIDTDDLLIETLRELKPDIKISNEVTKATNIYEAIKYQGVDKTRLYNITRSKMKDMAFKGKTIITSSVELMKDADYIFSQTNPEFILEKYDRTKELAELDFVKGDIIGISTDIAEAIKKSPNQLEGIAVSETTENAESQEVTIDDINKNLTVDNLAIAQERGYDALYKNNRYVITKVEENSVTLKALDGSTVDVEPSQITAVTAKEDVVATSKENEDFKGNEKILSTGDFEVDFDADDLKKAADDITKNIC